MNPPQHKTKIVCTIGPASRSPAILSTLIKSGMNVARLNFSHGTFAEHQENIRRIRQAAAKTGKIVGIMIDLPGVKMRVGNLPGGQMTLVKGRKVTLSTRSRAGNAFTIPIEYSKLARSVSTGSIIFLNDGFIQLKVERVLRGDVLCRVVMGGRLLSHKGLNLPGSRLFVDPITPTDLKMVKFGLSQGVTTFGLSFVERAKDIHKVREFAARLGHSVYLVAKIERRSAIEHFDEILKEANACMVARGDLGVEIPIEEVPAVQKKLIQRANVLGRPVITATQMLESMTANVRPTRAEVTDVANAILDGTDAVMLSEETAIGAYPVETVRTMARVAAFTESQRTRKVLTGYESERVKDLVREGNLTITDVISLNVIRAADKLKVKYIITPTSGGSTARRVSRFKPHCFILAYSTNRATCEYLSLSYGVHPFLLKHESDKRLDLIFKNVLARGLARKGEKVIVTERRLSPRPGDTDSLTIVTL